MYTKLFTSESSFCFRFVSLFYAEGKNRKEEELSCFAAVALFYAEGKNRKEEELSCVAAKANGHRGAV